MTTEREAPLNAENDAPGITYIDAPLPATVLNLAYRMHAEWERRNAEIDALRAAIQAVRDLHVKVENPRHGCCAPPQLCKGHAPECRAREHPLGGVPWPCATLRAIDSATRVLPPEQGHA